MEANLRGCRLSFIPRVARLGLVMLSWVVLSACDQENIPSEYNVINGTIESLRTDTAELTVRAEPAWPGWTKQDTLACVLTNDAEIYVNGRFRDFLSLAIGDAVKLVGYDEPSRRGERFVVSYAYITRQEPLPPAPDIQLPTSQPTSQPQED